MSTPNRTFWFTLQSAHVKFHAICDAIASHTEFLLSGFPIPGRRCGSSDGSSGVKCHNNSWDREKEIHWPAFTFKRKRTARETHTLTTYSEMKSPWPVSVQNTKHDFAVLF